MHSFDETIRTNLTLRQKANEPSPLCTRALYPNDEHRGRQKSHHESKHAPPYIKPYTFKSMRYIFFQYRENNSGLVVLIEM